MSMRMMKKTIFFHKNVFRILGNSIQNIGTICDLQKFWCRNSYFWKLSREFLINGLFDWKLLIWRCKSFEAHKPFDFKLHKFWSSQTFWYEDARCTQLLIRRDIYVKDTSVCWETAVFNFIICSHFRRHRPFQEL